MDIRAATRDDMLAVMEIYNDAVLTTSATADYEPQTLEQRLQWYDERTRAGYPTLVAVVGSDGVVGWASLSAYKTRYGYRFTSEVSVYVAAEHRGRGVGGALLPPLIEAGRAMGLHALVAAIDAQNEASLRLHRAHGFQDRGVLREVFTKFGRWFDVAYLELLL